MGYEEKKDLNITSRDLKTTIIRVLKETKKTGDAKKADINIIYCNLNLLDHHDAVRLDQILTILANKKEQEYQWASICMGKKFKTI